MFTSTIELITLATSNSLIVFCFCNFIIGILLLGGSKPTSHDDHDHDHVTPHPTVDNRKRNDINGSNERSKNNINGSNSTSSFGKNNATIGASSPSYVNRAIMIHDDAVNDNEEDDELRRRVEEFIDKINRGWKAEKLRTSPLV